MNTDITLLQVTAKEPIDEKLMKAIRADLYALEASISAAGAFDYQFKVNGLLANVVNTKRLDGAMITKNTTFSQCRLLLENPGNAGGTIDVDVRRYTSPNVALTGLTYLFTDSISSIGRVGSSLNTQSIARSTSQIATQSISRWKTQLNVLSIIKLNDADSELAIDGNLSSSANLVRINLSGTVDADWGVGCTIASCTASGNNGQVAIVAKNIDGGNNIVVINSSAVNQLGAAGTVDLDAWKYVYTNPVSSEFAAGEIATFASHTASANNGAFTVYAINQGGNNIIVFNGAGVAQAGVVGTVDTNRWKFALTSPAPSDYVVGELALTASHTTGGNNGNLRIVAVNSGGSNVVMYNPAGAAQGGAVGTLDTNRWTYVLPSDPSAAISVGDKVWSQDATATANRGEFPVVQVNRSSGLNVTVVNTAGLAQASSGGTLQSSNCKVSFAADQSSYLTTASRVKLVGLAPGTDGVALDNEYSVLQVNRGGGSNYNIVISCFHAAQSGACGRLALESKSLFDTRPSVVIPAYAGTYCVVSSNAVLNATQKIVPADTLVLMELVTTPSGRAKNLTVQLL